MPNRNINLIDTISGYELIKTRKKDELLIRSPEGANFILHLQSAKNLLAILLFDERINQKFKVPDHKLKDLLSAYEGDYSIDQASLRQDRSILAQLDGYTLLPSPGREKDRVHLRKDGVNFILSIPVLLEIVDRYQGGEI